MELHTLYNNTFLHTLMSVTRDNDHHPKNPLAPKKLHSYATGSRSPSLFRFFNHIVLCDKNFYFNLLKCLKYVQVSNLLYLFGRYTLGTANILIDITYKM